MGLLVESIRVDLKNSVLAFCRGNPGIKPDRCRHHEPVVIVRVLTDKIDAAGGAENPHVRAEHFPEARRQ